MLDDELTLTRLEMCVRGKSIEPLDKCLICRSRISMSCSTGIIEGCEDARRSFFLDELAHNFIVKVVDWGPLNLLPSVFFLFGLQSQLDEDLLKLFVDIINTELLEAVSFEDFESVDKRRPLVLSWLASL